LIASAVVAVKLEIGAPEGVGAETRRQIKNASPSPETVPLRPDVVDTLRDGSDIANVLHRRIIQAWPVTGVTRYHRRPGAGLVINVGQLSAALRVFPEKSRRIDVSQRVVARVTVRVEVGREGYSDTINIRV
jgi:hypothetical protein